MRKISPPPSQSEAVITGDCTLTKSFASKYAASALSTRLRVRATAPWCAVRAFQCGAWRTTSVAAAAASASAVRCIRFARGYVAGSLGASTSYESTCSSTRCPALRPRPARMCPCSRTAAPGTTSRASPTYTAWSVAPPPSVPSVSSRNVRVFCRRAVATHAQAHTGSCSSCPCVSRRVSARCSTASSVGGSALSIGGAGGATCSARTAGTAARMRGATHACGTARRPRSTRARPKRIARCTYAMSERIR